jgi:hypothetical protein
MLQPKVYIKELNIVREVEMIDFHNKQVSVYDIGIGFRGGAAIFSFDKVEFMENTGYVDINKKHICVGDIVEILGAYFEIKYRAYKGYVIKNKKYTLSLEANLDCVSVVGNIYENKELLGNE